MSAEATVVASNPSSNNLSLKKDTNGTSILDIFDWSSVDDENEISR